MSFSVIGVGFLSRIVMIPTGGISASNLKGSTDSSPWATKCRATDDAIRAIASWSRTTVNCTRNDADSTTS